MIVVHRHHDIMSSGERAFPNGISGPRSGDLGVAVTAPLVLSQFDGRLDDAMFFVSKKAVLSRMWVDPTHGDPWCGEAKLTSKLNSEPDAVMHASNREGFANRFQGLVARGQHDLQSSRHEPHCVWFCLTPMAQQLGVPGPLVPRHSPA